jgi:hypothetical protein
MYRDTGHRPLTQIFSSFELKKDERITHFTFDNQNFNKFRMSKAVVYSSQACHLSTIDIPSIATAMRDMKGSIQDVSKSSLLLQEASLSLESVIGGSNFMEISAHHEATALKQSAHLLDVTISKIQERISLLEVALKKKAIVPAILSTADDITVALHIAVNGPNIDWQCAETVLERLSILWTERLAKEDNTLHSFAKIFCNNASFRQYLWLDNCFDSNLVRLFEGGDCWRVRKSLELIHKFVDDAWDMAVSSKTFDALASIILQKMQSFEVQYFNEEWKWAYLIAKNQDCQVDDDILRLINSFLYSRKGKTAIACNVLKIVSAFISDDICGGTNTLNILDSPMIPALVLILLNEIENTHVIGDCLSVIKALVDFEHEGENENDGDEFIEREMSFFCMNFERCGICEALITIIDVYILDNIMIRNVLYIIDIIINRGERIDKFVSAGLFNALVRISESPFQNSEIPEKLLDYMYATQIKNIFTISRTGLATS